MPKGVYLRKVQDLTGQVFSRLTVIQYVGQDKHGNAVWLCRCLCSGKEIEVRSGNLRSGHAGSCGCLRQEQAMVQTFKHGHNSRIAGRSPTYGSWAKMVARCTNPHVKYWNYYGGAGITVCERWRNSFTAFLEDMGARPTGTSLGRFGDINNYSCGHCEQCKQNGWELNCAWQTRTEQAAEQKVKFSIVGRKPTEHTLTPEQRSTIHRKSGHTRWHIQRNIVKADCLYCVSVVESQVA